jgi:hypothetical protein
LGATKQKIFVSSQKDYILHMTKLNDNINMDSTIAGSINAGSCITITLEDEAIVVLIVWWLDYSHHISTLMIFVYHTMM